LEISPESAASTKNQKGGEGVGRRKEAQEAGEKPGPAVERGLDAVLEPLLRCS
jgi:hypothetical protein